MQKAKRTRMCRVGHDWIWATLPVHSTHLPRPLKSSNQSRPSPPKRAWIYAIFITKKWKILWQHFTFITRYMGVMVWRVAGECEGPGTLSLPSKRPPQLPPLIPMHPPRDSTPNLQTPHSLPLSLHVYPMHGLARLGVFGRGCVQDEVVVQTRSKF